MFAHGFSSGNKSLRSRKRLVYIAATLVTLMLFLPLQSQRWSIYAGACAGYTVLVFGLRRFSASSATQKTKPVQAIALTHLTFLAVVVAWVWLCIVLKPYLPYFLTTEDSSHPYFGLAFLGIFGLLGIEAIEQRWLRSEPVSEALISQDPSSKLKQ